MPTITLPAPVLTEKIGVMRPAATGPTFAAWANIYALRFYMTGNSWA